MKQRERAFVTIASANNFTEATNIKILLNRASIPYRVLNELNNLALGTVINYNIAPITFLVPSHLQQDALEALEYVFDVNTEEIPEICPACESPTQGKLECPGCGLTLA